MERSIYAASYLAIHLSVRLARGRLPSQPILLTTYYVLRTTYYVYFLLTTCLARGGLPPQPAVVECDVLVAVDKGVVVDVVVAPTAEEHA